MVNNIREKNPKLDDAVIYKLWTHIANDELIQFILINNIGCDDPQPYNYDRE